MKKGMANACLTSHSRLKAGVDSSVAVRAREIVFEPCAECMKPRKLKDFPPCAICGKPPTGVCKMCKWTKDKKTFCAEHAVEHTAASIGHSMDRLDEIPANCTSKRRHRTLEELGEGFMRIFTHGAEVRGCQHRG